jgi:hypothetical protein
VKIQSNITLLPSERKLPLDYPVFYSYCYIVEDINNQIHIVTSDIQGEARNLLTDTDGVQLYNCDIVTRGLI